MGTAEPDKTGASAAEDKPAEKVKEDTVSMQPVKRAVGANRGMDTQEDADERELGIKWRGTLAWAVFIVLWYWLLQSSLAQLVPPQEDARRELFKRVPLHVYIFSEAAFFCATVLNLISLVFEDTPEKKQLALLSAIIKGLSCHCDYLIITGQAVVTFDAHGALFLPSRYVQWSCSTPTMIFTLSRISDLTPMEIAATLLADWLMVVTGYMAAALPWTLAWAPLAVCFMCFGVVMVMLRRMIHSALAEATSFHARACLYFTLGSTVAIWNLFWVAWVIARLPWGISAAGEPLTIFCNFAAKVVFSSSIMYNNYVTIAQRRRRAEIEKEHTERIQAVEELSAAVGRKDEFIAVVGHELRTPLNAIIQLSGALARGAGGALQERARSWLETISGSAAHLLAIVNDIIIMQAAKSGTIMLRQEIIDLPKVLDGVMRTLTPLARRGVVLERVVHDKLPPIVGDKRRLMQVLSNLVGNALKFTERGKVSVKAYPDRGARHVIIKIVDSGVGIPKEKLSVIFEAFRQADMSRSRKHGGVGLGLSIAKELVHAHGGLVSVHSEGAGCGSTVVVKLPVLQQETDQDLEPAFRTAYEALGYHTDELLSPELARAEQRACPAFLPLTSTLWGGPGSGAAGGFGNGFGAGGSGFGGGAVSGGPPSSYAPSLSNLNNVRQPGGAGAAVSSGAATPNGAGSARRAVGSMELPLGAEAANMGSRMGAFHAGAMGPGSGRPSMALSAGSATPSRNPLMSMDMQNATVQTYRWSGETANSMAGGFLPHGGYEHMLSAGVADAFGSLTPPPAPGSADGRVGVGAGAGAGFRRGSYQDSGLSGAPPSRMSYEATRMSYEAGGEGGGAEGEEGGGGGREGGAPGLAVALMSSLYAPPDEEAAARANNPAAAAAARGVSVASMPGVLPVGARPDEREEDGGTIPGSGTTPAPGGFSARRADTAPARVSNERSSLGSSASTRLPALDEHHVLDDVGMAVGRGPSWEGERRRSGVSGVGGPPSSASASYLVTSNLHPAYTEAVDRASQVVAAAMEAQAAERASAASNAQPSNSPPNPSHLPPHLPPYQPYPAAQNPAQAMGMGSASGGGEQWGGEWESYVRSGGGGGGVADRSLAPNVVAANVRLSQQYDDALAEAAAKAQPLDPQWHTWVARIPDHHKGGQM